MFLAMCMDARIKLSVAVSDDKLVLLQMLYYCCSNNNSSIIFTADNPQLLHNKLQRRTAQIQLNTKNQL